MREHLLLAFELIHGEIGERSKAAFREAQREAVGQVAITSFVASA